MFKNCLVLFFIGSALSEMIIEEVSGGVEGLNEKLQSAPNLYAGVSSEKSKFNDEAKPLANVQHEQKLLPPSQIGESRPLDQKVPVLPQKSIVLPQKEENLSSVEVQKPLQQLPALSIKPLTLLSHVLLPVAEEQKLLPQPQVLVPLAVRTEKIFSSSEQRPLPLPMAAAAAAQKPIAHLSPQQVYQALSTNQKPVQSSVSTVTVQKQTSSSSSSTSSSSSSSSHHKIVSPPKTVQLSSFQSESYVSQPQLVAIPVPQHILSFVSVPKQQFIQLPSSSQIQSFHQAEVPQVISTSSQSQAFHQAEIPKVVEPVYIAPQNSVVRTVLTPVAVQPAVSPSLMQAIRSSPSTLVTNTYSYAEAAPVPKHIASTYVGYGGPSASMSTSIGNPTVVYAPVYRYV